MAKHDEMRDVKFQLMVSPSELTEIEEYRWKKRLESKAEAIRQLVSRGLEAEKMAEAAALTATPA